MRYSVILSILFFFILANSFAQTDTEFWFVAPEVSKNGGSNFDIPIYLRITTFNDPATVTVSEPANGGFTPIVINIPANGFSTIDLSPFLDMVENKPANTVLNYGIHIVASAPVSIYYEIASTYCLCNPELYTLKGKNAVGSDFLIPTQNFFSNAGGYSPTPYNAFDIVATDDNTAVTITPSKDIVGHAQGIPFVINLGKGQTWSALATSQLAANHLFGSKVTSTKPIAITMTDDLLYGITGCADIIGDQIVPVGITGKEYIAVKGNLTNDGNRAFILATQDATQVFIDGNPVPVATLNTGQLYNDDILASSAYIVTDKPVYVFQTSGFGCELGGALLPPILCTGSTRVVFARTTNQQLGLVISTHNGNQGNFLVNGDATMITAANFLPVPGTGGSWVSANLTLSLLQIPVGTTVSVTNSSGTFHLGLMIGNAGGGCSYGYYSDFSRLNLGPDQVMCAGSTKVLDAGPGWTSYLWNTGEITQSIPVNFPGTYSVTATDPGCSLTDTAVVSLYPVQAVSLGPDFALCNGLTQTITASGGPFTSYLWNTGAISSSIVVNSPGTYSVSVIDNNGCAGADTIHVTAAQGPLLTNNPASQAQCTGVPTAITLTADQPGSVFTRTASGSSPNVSGYSAGPGAFIDDILVNSGSSVETVTYTITPQNGSCIGTPADYVVTVNPALAVSVSIGSSANNICAGTPVTFTATPGNGGTTPGWQWKVNAINAINANNAVYTFSPVAGDVVTCELTSSEECTTGNTATSASITMTVFPNLPVSVSVSTPVTTVCQGAPVTFTATPGNGGTTPGWQWKVNAINAISANNANYTYTPVAGDMVTCELTSSETCTSGNPATSAGITMTVNPNLAVGVVVSPDAAAVCAGNPVTFFANPLSGGMTPAWQWKVNANNANNANNAVFTYSPVAGDLVTCEMTSSEACTIGNPATSAPVAVTVNPNLPVSVTVSTSSNIFCAGSAVTFTASPVHGGTMPAWQWKVNSINATGATNADYTYNPVSGDVVSCVLISSETCASGSPAISNNITMTAIPVLPAGITVTATANPFCPGTSVTFTATLLNGGTTPSYQWKVNAGNASNATNANYTYTPVAGDYVSCVMASNLACVSNSPVTSASILMTAHPVPNVSFIRCFDSISTTAAKPFKLRGGLPFGGTYSGPGVNSATGIFNPATAGAGTHTITYGYSNIFNCLSSASTQIFTFQSSLFTCGGILTDPRDSRHYSTFVLPNGSCWMKENLDFGTAVDGLVPQTDNCMPEKYVRNSPYGGQYSIFYQWDELMRYSSTEASQGLCPPGWHIPSSSEWNDLLVYYNGDGLAGGALKDAQLAGGFHSFQVGFLYLNNTWAFTTGQDAGSMYWTSTSTGNEGAVARGMNLLTRSVSVYNSSRSNAFPARCMKD